MRKELIAAKVWACAEKMRGSIDANDYKDFLFGLIFYKYLSEKELDYLKHNDYDEEGLRELTKDNEEELQYVRAALGYVIPYESLFSEWLKKGRQFTIQDVMDSVNMFETNIDAEYTRVYGSIFDSFKLAMSKLGLTPAEQTRMIKELVEVVTDIPSIMEDNGDALGFIYEYLMKNFAAGAGSKAGEFYTPAPVSRLMAKIIAHHLKDRQHMDVYDPASGSGSLLLNIGYEFGKYSSDIDNVKYYAQEKMKNTYNLGRMNLIMRNIQPYNIEVKNADTLENDWPPNPDTSTNEPLRVDSIAANPPYSLAWNTADKVSDPRFAYGLAPAKKADYAFVQHGMYHMKDDGIMAVVLPHGVLFRAGTEGDIRKNLIEHNQIDTIIGLPGGMFYGTDIPTLLLILRKNKTDEGILFIDASQDFEKKGKKNELTEGNIKKIFDAYISRTNIKNYSAYVNREQIIANDYNLNIPRYVSAAGDGKVTPDLFGLIEGCVPEKELAAYDRYWKVFPSLKEELYTPKGVEGYVNIKQTDLAPVVTGNKDVISYKQNIQNLLNEASETLKELLINNCETMKSDEIFNKLIEILYTRIENDPLLDKYKVYDLIYNTFKTIKSDIDFIQDNQGMQKACQTLHIKEEKDTALKFNGKETATGEIIPIEMIWDNYMAEEKAEWDKLYAEKEDLAQNKKDMMENMSEDIEDFLWNKNRTDFQKNKVTKALKDDVLPDETLDILREWLELNNKTAALDKKLKGITDFISRAVSRLTNLTEDECKELLEEKWIKHLSSELAKMADITIQQFQKNLKETHKGYEQSALELNRDIEETNNSLIEQIGHLTYPTDTAGTLNALIKFLSM